MDQNRPPTAPSIQRRPGLTIPSTIKAKAFKTDWLPSETATATYTIISRTVATPTFAPPAGNIDAAQTIEILCATDGVDIYYTIDNSEPTTSSTLYTTPITLVATTTIKAKAFKTDWLPSATNSATY